MLPENLVREKNALALGLPDANSPQASGLGDDLRQLGIAIYWMQMQPQ
jgi:hypothetical protein